LSAAITDMLHFLLGRSLGDWFRGALSFQTPFGMSAMLAGFALLIVAVVILYRHTTARTTSGFKSILILLRFAILALLLFCLLKPVLITSSAKPRDSYMGILIDNSRSMMLPDVIRSKSRGDVATEMLFGKAGLVEQLSEDFTVRAFAFDRSARSISEPTELTFDGTRTYLAQALHEVGQTMQGLPLAALVLVTDGADNAGDDPLLPAGIFNALHIPLHVIGMDSDPQAKDIEISRVHTAGTVRKGGLFEVQVTVVNQGYNGLESELLIENGERVAASQKIVLGPPGHPQQYLLHLTPDQDGSMIYTARLAVQKDETNAENNRLPFLVEKSGKPAGILYIEGHPRNEYKFIRRAVEGDDAIRLKTYLMTGPQKYLRQNIESPLELANGYPDSEAALFTYDAIILGDVPADFFKADQLAQTRAFVSRRGGGFLMLGGATAFDVGYRETPIEELLPVTLLRENDLPPELQSRSRTEDDPINRLFAPRLTDEGWRSLILRLEVDDDANRQTWKNMPILQGINPAGNAKPGATVLAVHPVLTLNGEPLPLLAYQRYGRGRTMVLMTATTWRWQMLQPHQDTSHERFWRQLLRWLSGDAPPPVEILLKTGSISTGDPVDIRARIYDETYQPVMAEMVWLKITDPDGALRDLRMSADIARPGEYTAQMTASKPGIYQLEVSPPDSVLPTGPATRHILVADEVNEMRDAAPNQALLAKIAAVGGGQYYRPEAAEKLIKNLRTIRAMDTVNSQAEVWDIPLIFFLLLTCLGLEWLLRRRKGLS
jgi:uncharacterized membrane protein